MVHRRVSTPLLGVALLGVLGLIGPPTVVLAACCVVIETVAVAAAWCALRNRGLLGSRAWPTFVFGFSLWALGDLTWLVEHITGRVTTPMTSQLIYMAGLSVGSAGVFGFARQRRHRTGGGFETLADAVIMLCGAMVPALALVGAPALRDSDLHGLGRLSAAAFPMFVLLLAVAGQRFWTSPGRRGQAFLGVTLTIAAVFVANGAWAALHGAYGQTPMFTRVITPLWASPVLFVAHAARCADARELVERVAVRDRNRSVFGLTPLVIGSLMPAFTVMVGLFVPWTISWQMLAVGTALVNVLVLVRLIGLFGRVRNQAAQLGVFERIDELTGALNPHGWKLEMERACLVAAETGEPLCVAVIDLDRFRDFDATQGRAAGDLLLRDAVAAWHHRIEDCAMLARLDDDRFALRFVSLEMSAVIERVQVLQAATPAGQSFSAGVAQWLPGTPAEVALDAALAALTDAKRLGRNRIEWTAPAIRDALPDRLAAGWVVVQPIVCTSSGEVFGHEVLSRFHHDRDIPAVFARAHREGHGDALEAHVVTTALTRPGRPEGTRVFLNVSAAALGSERFWAELPASLDGAVIELLEDTSAVDWSQLLPLVNRLAERGARIAVDDLGAGAGDLRRLLTVRPQVVKIDRALVDGCADDAVRLDLIRVVVDLAHAGGAMVCAEGIERGQDLALLRQIGVDLVQGYLLARPGDQWRSEPFDLDALGATAAAPAGVAALPSPRPPADERPAATPAAGARPSGAISDTP